MLYVALDFKNDLTVDALVDSRAYVSAKAEKEVDINKQQAPSKTLKIEDPSTSLIHVGNGQLEKPKVTATLKFDFGDHIFAEHFVVKKFDKSHYRVALHDNTTVRPSTLHMASFISHTWQCKSKMHLAEQVFNIKLFSFTTV